MNMPVGLISKDTANDVERNEVDQPEEIVTQELHPCSEGVSLAYHLFPHCQLNQLSWRLLAGLESLYPDRPPTRNSS
jgi:hypothetical protein